MSRDAAATFGRLVAEERCKRTLRGKPLSTTKLAAFANAYIVAKKLPVKHIHQQEISKLENATPQDGPKRRQPWWDVLREFLLDGHLDRMIEAAETPLTAGDSEVVVDFQIYAGKREPLVRTPDGEVVGRIVWNHE